MTKGREHWHLRRVVALMAFTSLIVLPLCALVSCSHCRPTPDGVYYDQYIGSSQPTYWVFEAGRACLRERGAPDVPAGTYVRSNDTWILRGDPKAGDVILKPTVIGIRMISGSESHMNKYLPRRGFSWLKSGRVYDPPPEGTKLSSAVKKKGVNP